MPGYESRYDACHTVPQTEKVRTVETPIEMDTQNDWYGENARSRAMERRAEKIAEAIADGFALATSFSYPTEDGITVVDTFILA